MYIFGDYKDHKIWLPQRIHNDSVSYNLIHGKEYYIWQLGWIRGKVYTNVTRWTSRAIAAMVNFVPENYDFRKAVLKGKVVN